MRRIRKTKIKWQRFHGIFINTLQLLNFKSKMQWTWYELCFQAWRLYYSWFPERIWWYGCCMVSLSCLWCPSIFRLNHLTWMPGLGKDIIFLHEQNCVGGPHIRGCFILKIAQCVYFITMFTSIYKISYTYLISS